MAKTDPINTANPAGSSDPKQGDDHIRTLAKAVAEILGVDHYVGASSPYSEDAAGEHKKVILNAVLGSDPDPGTGKGALYIKTADAKPELHYQDAEGSVVQLTRGGALGSRVLDLNSKSQNVAASLHSEDANVILELYDNGTTGGKESALRRVSDVLTLSANGGDNRLGTATGSDDRAIADKAYVDDQIVSAKRDYIQIIDSKASGNDGQSLAAGGWRKRDLTNEVSDTGSDASIASSQITLAAGTYECRIWCPVYDVNEFISRLYNVTDASVEILGTCGNGVANITSPGWIMGRFTIADTKVFQIQTYPGDSATTGDDAGISGINNIYTVAEFWKIN